MHRLSIGAGGIPGPDTLFRLSRGSPDGLLFPKLELLYWDVYETNFALPFFHLFLSPRLRRITFYTNSYIYHLPWGQVAGLAQIILVLPTSLESLDVDFGQGNEEPVKNALSSFICRCGPSLRSFGSRGPLSDVATLHLTQLPNLSRWRPDQEPPQVTSTHILQSLEEFRLNKGGALPWLRFFALDGKGTLLEGSASGSHAPFRGRLKSLDLPDGTVVDSTFLSSIVNFRNLVKLRVRNDPCENTESCPFRLTDNDMTDLAAALPHLKSLRLGHPCRTNTLKTTVASLMSLSIHCPDLLLLETYFNTKTIAGDMRGLLDGGAEHNKPKCQLRSSFVGVLPLELDSDGLRTVAMGFRLIFPHMTHLVGYNDDWPELRRQMPGVSGYNVEAEAVVP